MVDLVIGNGTNATTGASSYTYIRYASDASGTGISATPAPGLDYIAIKNTNTEIASPVASDFTGLWFNWKGPAGEAVNTVLSGSVNPTTEGSDSDYYINYTTMTIFGPKAGGTWPSGIAMIGDDGPAGADGADGAAGTDGTDGATILFGDGAPSNGIGANGDSYVDTTNHVFYYNKTAGTWPNSFSMLGPTGDTGPSGNTILYGAGAPDNGTGSNGDSYYDTTNKVFYANKAAGVWPGGSSLVGPTGSSGTNGTNGNTILYGTTPPNNASGNNGDTYIDTTNKVAYFNKTAGVWPAGASLVGPTGATGSAGATGAQGAAGDKGGDPFTFSTTTVMADPGSGFIRFNAGTTGATTQIAQSTTMNNAASASAFMATARINDVWRWRSNSTNKFCVFQITSKTNNTSWYLWGVTYIAGVLSANNEAGVWELIYGGIRVDSDGNLLDPAGNNISGVDSGTYAALPDPAINQKEFNLVTNYGPNGILYFVPDGGTRFVVPFEQPVFDDVVEFKYIAPNAAITWTASNNGGKVRLTASGAHGLTTSPAVGCSISVSAGTNWTAGSFHQIATVVSTTVIDLTTTWASQGVPTIAAANTEVDVYAVALPPLNPKSVVSTDLTNVYTSSTNIKRCKLYLDTAELFNITNSTASAPLLNCKLEFRNRNATNVQRTLSPSGNGTGLGVMTAAQVSAAVDTSVSKNIRISFQPVSANEMISLDSLRIAIRN